MQTLAVRLQHAQQWQVQLEQDLAHQKELVRLERQEHVNQELEAELWYAQEMRQAEDDDNARSARVRDEITRLCEEQEQHEEDLRLQRVKAEMEHKKRLTQMEHDMEMERLQLLAWVKQQRLQDDLEHEAGLARGEGATNTWAKGAPVERVDVNMVQQAMDHNVGSVAESGIHVLANLGLNPNTLDVIRKAGSRASSVPHRMDTSDHTYVKTVDSPAVGARDSGTGELCAAGTRTTETATLAA